MNLSKHIICFLILISTGGILTRLLTHDTKIVNGEISKWQNERHFASIRVKSVEENKGYGNGHICGGSLIRDNIILTAAHCLKQQIYGQTVPYLPSQLTIVLGSMVRILQQSNTMVRSVVRIKIHEGFQSKTYLNDIGLILLNETVIECENAHIDPIRMSAKSPDIGTECRVSGFGYQNYVRNSTNFLKRI